MSNKIVQHPASDGTPQMCVAEALGIAQAGQMQDVCIMWSDEEGRFHIGWSGMTNADMAAYAIALTYIAGNRLVEE